MKTNPENIPSIVFDWLEAHDFQGLSADQNQEVLKHFAEEEYNELRQTIVGIKTLDLRTQSESQAMRKQPLLARFDAIYSSPLVSVREDTNRGGALLNWAWKAAAVFLFFISAGLIYQKMTVKNSGTVVSASKIDTLYVIKEVASAPKWIYDTVFIHLKSKPVNPSHTIDSGLASTMQTSPIQEFHRLNSDPLTIVSLSELDNTSNRPKRNSMKDDSLLRRYSFVTL